MKLGERQKRYLVEAVRSMYLDSTALAEAGMEIGDGYVVVSWPSSFYGQDFMSIHIIGDLYATIAGARARIARDRKSYAAAPGCADHNAGLMFPLRVVRVMDGVLELLK